MLSWFVSGERINYLPMLKSEANNWSAITEFNNCFIIQSPSLFFNEYLREAKPSAIFHARAITEKRKVWFVYACNQTQLDDFAHEQTFICRQLFAGHMVGFWLMKKKNSLHGSHILSVFFRISNQALLSQMKHLKNWRTAFVVLLLQLVLYSLLCFFYYAPVVGDMPGLPSGFWRRFM